MQHTCRGAISLENAQVQGDEFTNFVVSNGTNQTFHLRAATEQEKQKWINALELAKKAKHGSGGGGGSGNSNATANYNSLFFNNMVNQNESDDDEDTIEAEKSELENMLHTMQEKLNELNLSQDFVQKHINALNKSLNELNNLQTKPEEITVKTITERSGICKIALIGLSTHCQEFIKLAQLQARKMNKISELEREQRMRLEEMVQDMAKQQSNIELQLTRRGKDHRRGLKPAGSGQLQQQQQQQPVVGLVQAGGAESNQRSSGQQLGSQQQQQRLVGQALMPGLSNDSASNQLQHQQLSQQQQQQVTRSNLTSKSAGESSSGSSIQTQSSNTNKASQDYDEDNGDQGLNDDEFHDAVEEINFSVTLPRAKQPAMHMRNPSSISKLYLQESDESDNEEEGHQTIKVTMHKNKDDSALSMVAARVANSQPTAGNNNNNNNKRQQSVSDLSLLKGVVRPVKQRRTAITPRPNYAFNLWGIMKNCIGKDLSKIPIPVNFSEPLSMLQRITEELEYSDILDKAAACDDQWEQMAYIAAFTISAYSTTATRTNKPFNPLLGETYECDRTDDFGWRSIAEQVSHHPPGVAMVRTNTIYYLDRIE
jgi:hypothetical protein